MATSYSTELSPTERAKAVARAVADATTLEIGLAAIPAFADVPSPTEIAAYLADLAAKPHKRVNENVAQCLICEKDFGLEWLIVAKQQDRHVREHHPPAVCAVCGIILVNRGAAHLRHHRINGCAVWPVLVARGWFVEWLDARGFLHHPTTQFFPRSIIDAAETKDSSGSKRFFLLHAMWENEIKALLARVEVPAEIVAYYVREWEANTSGNIHDVEAILAIDACDVVEQTVVTPADGLVTAENDPQAGGMVDDEDVLLNVEQWQEVDNWVLKAQDGASFDEM